MRRHTLWACYTNNFARMFMALFSTLTRRISDKWYGTFGSHIASRDIVLDFWRGIAILMVIAHHGIRFRTEHFFYGVFPTLFPSAQGIFSAILALAELAGPYGVKVFFVVSGFIITKLMLREEEKQSRVSVLHFYARRFTRIIPAYLAYMIGLLLVALMGFAPFSLPELTSVFTFTCNIAGGGVCGIDTIHLWTLAVEMQFYLFWPLVFVMVPRRHRVSITALAFGVSLMLSAAEIGVTGEWIDNARAFACLLIGALYAMSSSFAEFVRRYGFYVVLGIAACIAVLSLIPDAHEIARRLYWEAQPFGLLTVIVAAYRFPRLHRTLVFRAIAGVGLASYSLYLWQSIFLIGSLAAYLWLLVPIALASYFFIEKPLIRWGRAYFVRS